MGDQSKAAEIIAVLRQAHVPVTAETTQLPLAHPKAGKVLREYLMNDMRADWKKGHGLIIISKDVRVQNLMHVFAKELAISKPGRTFFGYTSDLMDSLTDLTDNGYLDLVRKAEGVVLDMFETNSPSPLDTRLRYRVENWIMKQARMGKKFYYCIPEAESKWWSENFMNFMMQHSRQLPL